MAVRTACIICLAAFVGTSAAAKAHEAKGPDTTPIRNFVLTSEKVRSYRSYTAVERPVLRPGDALYIYGEPENFGWHSQNGSAKFDVVVSVQVRKADGRAAARNIAPLPLKHGAASQPSDFFFSLRLSIRAPAGSYMIDVRLRDTATERTIEKSFPFSVSYRRALPPSETVAADNPVPPALKLPAPQKAPRSDCKKYFPQIGTMAAVPCEQ